MKLRLISGSSNIYIDGNEKYKKNVFIYENTKCDVNTAVISVYVAVIANHVD